MTEYVFSDRECNMPLLREQLVALNLPGFVDIERRINPPGPRLLVTCGVLSAQQQGNLANAIAAHDHTARTSAQQTEATARAADATDRAAIRAIIDKLDGDVTAAEVKALLLRVVRRLHRMGVLG